MGQTFLSEEPGGIFVSFQQFLADLGVVVTGFAESTIRFPWPRALNVIQGFSGKQWI